MPNERSQRGCYNGAENIILSFQIYYNFLKSTLIYTAYISLRIVKTHFNKGRKACCNFKNKHLTCMNHISIVFYSLPLYLL